MVFLVLMYIVLGKRRNSDCIIGLHKCLYLIHMHSIDEQSDNKTGIVKNIFSAVICDYD
jgi:hypothetical protein